MQRDNPRRHLHAWAGFAGVDKKKLEILALIVWCRANPSNKGEIELTFR